MKSGQSHNGNPHCQFKGKDSKGDLELFRGQELLSGFCESGTLLSISNSQIDQKMQFQDQSQPAREESLLQGSRVQVYSFPGGQPSQVPEKATEDNLIFDSNAFTRV